jgi:Ca2+-binding EF-hand superfamily protein
MSDIDTVIAKVVEDIWGTYDKDNSGALDKEETKQFVKDTLKEMADGDDEEDFNKCFEEFDKDGSGTIEKDEMALFIKKVAGL